MLHISSRKKGEIRNNMNKNTHKGIIHAIRGPEKIDLC